MKKLVAIVLHAFVAVIFAPQSSYGQITAINIAQGKKITATSTCGVGVSERERFCMLATVPGKLEILGLSCDDCEPSVPSRNHPIEYAIDGTELWWQSPPLSRGLQYQKVNITIDLGQVSIAHFVFQLLAADDNAFVSLLVVIAAYCILAFFTLNPAYLT